MLRPWCLSAHRRRLRQRKCATHIPVVVVVLCLATGASRTQCRGGACNLINKLLPSPPHVDLECPYSRSTRPENFAFSIYVPRARKHQASARVVCVFRVSEEYAAIACTRTFFPLIAPRGREYRIERCIFRGACELHVFAYMRAMLIIGAQRVVAMWLYSPKVWSEAQTIRCV